MDKKTIYIGDVYKLTEEDKQNYLDKKPLGILIEENIETYINRLNVTMYLDGGYPNIRLEQAFDEIDFKKENNLKDEEIYAYYYRKTGEYNMPLEEFKQRKKESKQKRKIKKRS